MIAVLGVHLLAVDLAMAGPLVVVGLQWRAGRREDAAASPLARRLAGWSMAAAAIGIALGLAALVLTPHVETEPYRRALAAISPLRWWFVAGELAFYFVCMAAYVGPWRRMQRWPRCHALIAILAGTDLMYHFPPLFAVVSTLSLRPQFLDVPLNHATFWKLLLEPQTLAMVLHHWLAGVSVAAMAALLLCERMGTGTSRRTHSSATPVDRTELVPNLSQVSNPNLATAKWAARIALAATLMQLPVGIGLLLVLPGALQNPLLGDDWVSSLLFGISLVLALGLMHHLTVIALGDVRRGAVVRSAGMMAATILLMAATLQRARHQALAPLSVAHVAGTLRVP
jgi:hypothetical protein